MAIVYSYPTATPELQDLLIGTEMAVQGGEDAPRTRTFTIGSIIGLAESSAAGIYATITSVNLKANIASPTFTGVVTSPSFVKLGGSSAQYLMADGDTTTMPTLQQVTTANATTTNTITINKTTDQSALIITGSASDPVSSLISLTAGGGVCLKADGGGGGYSAIEGYSTSGYGIYGRSDFSAGVAGQSADGVGVAGGSVNGNGGSFSSVYGTALRADVNSGTALVVIGSSPGAVGTIVSSSQGINVTKGGISITGAAHTGTTSQLSLSLNSATKPTSNTWTVTSDSRVKTNINPYTKGLETILAINPITYDYNGKAGFDTAVTSNIGVIAQDVLNVIPESINTFYAKLNEEDEEKTELYNFDSHALTFILINAVKQLSAEIELLKSI